MLAKGSPLDEPSTITEVDIARIEAALGVNLPEAYARAFVAEAADPFGDSFYSSAEEVIRDTDFNRREGYFGQPWPLAWVVIGTAGNGDDFFVDAGRPDCPVFAARHERTIFADSIGVDEGAPSVEAFVTRKRAAFEAFRRSWDEEE